MEAATQNPREQTGYDLISAQGYLAQLKHFEGTQKYFEEAQKFFSHHDDSNTLIKKSMEEIFKSGTPEQKETIFNHLVRSIKDRQLSVDLRADLVKIRDTFLCLDELKITIKNWATNKYPELIKALDYSWGGGSQGDVNNDIFGIESCKKNALSKFPTIPDSRESAKKEFNNAVQNALKEELTPADQKNFNAVIKGITDYEKRKNTAQSWCSLKRDQMSVPDKYEKQHCSLM